VIKIENSFVSVVAVAPSPLLAVTVKLNVPASVGVPVIAPVVGFNSKPGGKLFGGTENVVGVGCPFAVIFTGP
jgi:hypothetical protein